MIGVHAKKHEAEIVAEFFELFKTPWEFFDKNHSYDVLISTKEDFGAIDAKLVIIYDSSQNPFDSSEGIKTKFISNDKFLQVGDVQIPIYGQLSAITGHGIPLLQILNIVDSSGLEIHRPDQCIIRIGYDLFDEVLFLLSNGQPPENALIPTLDLHISTLRNLILRSSIPLVEIPPVPAGHNFITCLTHDIDFIRIRDHKFDHTMWGFLYRCIVGTLIDVFKGERDWKDLYQNWKAVVTLPFVYLGLLQDFWFQFDRYMEIERAMDARSTFFLIPFKNRVGEKVSGKISQRRASKYDITDIPDVVRKLIDHGFEVGVHGIDSWHNTKAACKEKARIADISGKKDVGIRMHWLCFDKNTFQTLEEAEFSYDSTFGYNDAVGYRAGTAQAFRPIDVKNILELPLNIQDIALFNPKHMSLNKYEAWKRCQDLIEKASSNGGILTILWHDRSLSPERLYEDFYIKLLNELKNKKVWFATAMEACNWFNNRRAAKYGNIEIDENVVHIKMLTDNKDSQPPMKMRIYHPAINHQSTNYIDVPWRGENELSISVSNLKGLKTA